MWKITILLHSNLGTSEFPVFVFFFQRVALLSQDEIWVCCLGDGLNHSMSITVFCCCHFNLKVKKSFLRKLSLNGVPKGVWNESIPILTTFNIPTNLFCHSVFTFTNSNMLISTYAQMITQWSTGVVSPPKVWKLSNCPGNFTNHGFVLENLFWSWKRCVDWDLPWKYSWTIFVVVSDFLFFSYWNF